MIEGTHSRQGDPCSPSNITASFTCRAKHGKRCRGIPATCRKYRMEPMGPHDGSVNQETHSITTRSTPLINGGRQRQPATSIKTAVVLTPSLSPILLRWYSKGIADLNCPSGLMKLSTDTTGYVTGGSGRVPRKLFCTTMKGAKYFGEWKRTMNSMQAPVSLPPVHFLSLSD